MLEIMRQCSRLALVSLLIDLQNFLINVKSKSVVVMFLHGPVIEAMI